LGSGCFDLQRGEEFQPGDLSGRAVRAGGNPVPHPQVILDGTGRTNRGGADGVFLVRGLTAGQWLARKSVDDDSNGWPELAAHTRFNMGENPFGLAGRATFVLLGDVEL